MRLKYVERFISLQIDKFEFNKIKVNGCVHGLMKNKQLIPII